jgi:hypothetical protein
MKRMEQLYEAVAAGPCRVFVEIGVYRGHRVRRVAREAFRKTRSLHYYGFDLFQECSAEDMAAESTPQPLAREEVENYVRRFSDRMARRPLCLRRTLRCELIQGYTRDTLPAFAALHPRLNADVILIDGGHSLATIATDWLYCSRLVAPQGVIFLDDYYDSQECASQFGCNTLVDQLERGREWSVTVLPERDHSPRAGGIRMVRVQRAT